MFLGCCEKVELARSGFERLYGLEFQLLLGLYVEVIILHKGIVPLGRQFRWAITPSVVG